MQSPISNYDYSHRISDVWDHSSLEEVWPVELKIQHKWTCTKSNLCMQLKPCGRLFKGQIRIQNSTNGCLNVAVLNNVIIYCVEGNRAE